MLYSRAQRIYVVKRLTLQSQYAVSTSRYGLGSSYGSYRTPTGVHAVAEKIGQGEPLLMRFKARGASGEIVSLNPYTTISSNDVICTRILWLTGLEHGINQGGQRDSKRRCIYIHGTIDEKRIGRPSSIGCIRMRNQDLIELFDILQVGSLVHIF